MSQTSTHQKRPAILTTSVVALLGLGFLLAVPDASADEYWDGTSYPTDGSGVANGKGGPGVWSAAAANWVDAAGRNPKLYDPTQLAIFSTIGGTISVTDNLAFSALRFDADAYSIEPSGGTLAPKGVASVTVGAGLSAALDVQLIGTGGINVNGTGTLTIGNSTNTYSGGTVLNAGARLNVNGSGTDGSGTPLGTGTLTINGGTLGTTIFPSSGSTGTNITNTISVRGDFSIAPNVASAQAGNQNITLTGLVDLTGATRTITGIVNQGQVHFGTGGIGVAGETAGLTLTTNLVGSGQYVAFITDAGNVNRYTGVTTVTNGAFLVFEGTATDGAVQGNLDIEGNGVVDYLQGSSAQIADGATVTVNSRGNIAGGEIFEGLDMFTSTGDTFATLNGNGTVGLAAATLTVSDGTFSGQISNGRHNSAPGPGSLVKVSGGMLILSGANTYTGTTTVAAGTLQAGAANTFSPFSAVTVNTGATLDLNNFNQVIGSLTDGGAGGATVNLGTGTLTVGNDGSNTTYASVIQGSGGLTKIGTGTQTLLGANTYSGATTVNGGTLALDATTNPSVLAANSALVMGGGTLTLTGPSGTSQILNGLTVNSGPSVISISSTAVNTVTLDLRGAGTQGIIRNAGGTIDFRAAGGTFGTNAIVQTHQANDASGILGAWATVNGGAAFAANDGSDHIVAYTGYTDISTNGGIVTDNTNSNVRLITGAGAGTDTLSGPTNINTLTQNATDATTIDTGGNTLRVGVIGGIFITPGSANLIIGNAANQGTLTAGGNSDNVAGELILENNSTSGTLTINSAIANNVSGVVSVTVAGSGLTVLAGTNTYTGTTLISSGTLRTDATGAIPTNSAVVVDLHGTLNLNNNAQTIGSLSDGTSGGGTVSLGSAVLTVGGDNTNTTFSGLIQGSGGSLVKNGTGALTIAGPANSYTGGTTLNSGTLYVNGSTANGTGSPLGTGTLTIAGGTTLGTTVEPTSGTTGTTLTNSIVVNGDFSIAANVDALNPSSQNLTLNGSIDLGSTTRTITGTTAGGQVHLGGVITSSGAGLTFNASAGVLADATNPFTAFTFQGSAANTYQGTTTVNSGVVVNLAASATAIPGDVDIEGTGVVRLVGANEIAASSNVTNNSTGNTIKGAVTAGLELANNNLTISTLLGNGTVGLGAGTLTITGASTFSGVIADGTYGVGGGLTVNETSPAQIFVLSGANTYTGNTTIVNGTLQAGATNTIPNKSAVLIDAGATFDLHGFDQNVATISDGSTGGGHITLGSANLTAGSGNFDFTVTYSGDITGTGGFTKVGVGTLSLNGNNTYTGPTHVNGGTLDLGGSNKSAITISPGNTLLVESAGSVNTGAGQTAVTMTQGTTSVNAGTVSGTGAGSIGVAMTGSSNTLTNLAGATIIAETAIVISNPTGTNTIFNAGTITGTSGTAIDARTSNGLILTNTGTINDRILLGNGTNTIELTTNSPAQPAIVGGTGIDTLRLAGGGSGTLNLSTVTSLDILDKIGGGLWTLTGAGSFPLGTTIRGGTINLLGNLTSNTSIASGGTLAGTGMVVGYVVNSGIVMPGIPSSVLTPIITPGTLSIKGNYQQNTDGTLVIQVNGGGAGQYSQLSINGHAQLNGALVIRDGSGKSLKFGQKLTFLTASGGVSGTFSDVTNPFETGNLVIGKVIYEPNDVILETAQGSFMSIDSQLHLTPNQRAVATALDNAAGDPRAAALLTYLDSRPLKKLPSDFDQIAPEEIASVFRIGVSLADVQARNVQRRTADLRAGASGFSATGFQTTGGPNYSGGMAGANGSNGADGKTANAPVADRRWGTFITGVGDFVHVGDSANASGYDLNTGGVTVGADYKLTDHIAVGVTAGYVGTNANLASDGRLLVNGGRMGAYGTYYSGGFHTDAAVTGGLSSYSIRRSSLQGDAFGGTDGGELDVLAAAGYDWKLDALTIGPTAAFQYTYVGIDSFTERGSLSPLRYAGQHQTSLRSTFGLRMAYDWKVGNVIVRPEGEFSWQHEYGDRSYSVESAFASGAGSIFSVSDTELGRDSLLFGGGVSVLWNTRTATYLYYDADLLKKEYYSQSVTGGLRMNF